MAERAVVYRDLLFATAVTAVLALLVLAAGPSGANEAVSAVPQERAPANLGAQSPTWVGVPRITGRLRAPDIGLVINTADPYSVAVGEHCIAARGLHAAQVMRLELPVKPSLTRVEFTILKQSIEAHFGPATQVLALVWVTPYAVECNSINGALAPEFNAALCGNTCARSRSSSYFNSSSLRPWSNPGWRPSMLLAARTTEQAKALIDRGVSANGSFSNTGRAPVSALMLMTDDVPRRVRMALYPPGGLLQQFGVDVRLEPAPQWLPQAAWATT